MTLLKRYKEESKINYQRVLLKRLVCLEVEDLVDTLNSLEENILIELHNIYVKDCGLECEIMPTSYMNTLFKGTPTLELVKLLSTEFDAYHKYFVKAEHNCYYYSFNTIYDFSCPIKIDKIAEHIINNPLLYVAYLRKLDCIFVINKGDKGCN